MESESYDIFISYAEPDNRLPAPLNDWVQRLYDSLPGLIQFHLKRMPKVYFAKETAEANRDWSHIENCCKTAKVFVAVVSPNYLARDWPQREFKAFVSSKENLDGLFIAALMRVGPDDHPVLGSRTHSAFYQQHPYRADEGAEAFPVQPTSEAFQDALFRLAGSVARHLKRVESEAGSVAFAPQKPQAGKLSSARVLLAQPSGDYEQHAEGLRTHLEQYGTPVIAASEFPQGGEDFTAAFSDALRQATHVVQLLGPRRGRRPPDLPEGYVVWQAESARSAGLPVFQWRALDCEPADVADIDYAELLVADSVVASTLEEFKRDVLRRITEPLTLAVPGRIPKKGFKVFVNAELADRTVAERLRSELAEYPVFHPDYDIQGSNQEITLQHLRDCKALILLYGRAGLHWVNAQIGEAFKHRGEDLPGGAVCIGPPTEKKPLNFSVPDLVELDCRDGDDWSVEPIRRRLAELSQ